MAGHGADRASCTRTRPCAFKRVRRYLRRRGITDRIARIGVDSSERLGRQRWVVERMISWLLAFRRLAIRYDRTAATVTGVATLAVTVVCARRLPRKNHGNYVFMTGASSWKLRRVGQRVRRGSHWRPSGPTLPGSSHCWNASRTAGHSWSVRENQALSRVRLL